MGGDCMMVYHFIAAHNLCTKISEEVKKLYGELDVKNRKGIFEYLYGGSVDTKLLDVRVFDEVTKLVYSTKLPKPKPTGKLETVRSLRHWARW